MADPAPAPIPEARLLPWHADAAAQLRTAWSAQRLPHALVLHGPEGLGKGSLAAWLAAAALCERSSAQALDMCGECASCTLIRAGTHPDLLWVAPEEGKQQISIEHVRAACERLTRTSFRQGYKVVIVEPAHQMTLAASNSVLKTLEEPAPSSLLILITSQPSSLLPTVRSRCQKIQVARPGPEAAMAWLERTTGRRIDPALIAFAGGAPLRALSYADGQFDALNEQMWKSLNALLSGRADVTQIAAEWEKDGLPDRLVWLDLWLTSLARAALSGTDERVTFPGGAPLLPTLPRTLNISDVYGLVDRARTLKAQLVRTALQRELAVESWLFALLDLFQAPSAPARS